MIPYVRDLEVVYGRCDQASPLLRRVTANNPSAFTFKGSGTYIVGRGDVAVIDPGPDDAEHLEALMAALEGERVTHILVTHHHIDHSPLSAALKARTGATIYGHRMRPGLPEDDGVQLDAGHDRAFTPDVDLKGGETLEGPGWTFEAIATPGHTSDHLCYALREENACFTGDHIMGWSTTVIGPPDGDMTDYLQSLATIRDRGFASLWPTHGPPVRDVDPFLAAYQAHRQERLDQILGALEAGPARIAELVPALYADVDSRLWPAASRSMLAAIIHLVRQGRLAAEGPPGPDSLYRLAG